MRQEDLIQGSLVRLKSGGPVMTAECIFDSGELASARCRWFDKRGRGVLRVAKIRLDALEPAEFGET